jgi:hypothetical protein
MAHSTTRTALLHHFAQSTQFQTQLAGDDPKAQNAAAAVHVTTPMLLLGT